MGEKKSDAVPSTYSPSSSIQADFINNKDLHSIILPSDRAYNNNSNGQLTGRIGSSP